MWGTECITQIYSFSPHTILWGKYRHYPILLFVFSQKNTVCSWGKQNQKLENAPESKNGINFLRAFSLNYEEVKLSKHSLQLSSFHFNYLLVTLRH